MDNDSAYWAGYEAGSNAEIPQFPADPELKAAYERGYDDGTADSSIDPLNI